MEEGRFAKELYYLETQYLTEPPSTKISNGELRCSDGNDDDNGNIDDDWLDAGSSEEEPSKDRELQKMCDQFHTLHARGYRDGVIVGKEAAAQEGFNIGFKESVVEGYNWGIVRGTTSAVACLPDGLKKRLIAEEEKRSSFQDLYGSVHSVSTADALKLFHDTMKKRGVDQCEQDKASLSTASVHSVHSLSTTDTLKLFHDEILKKRELDQCEQDKARSSMTGSYGSTHSVSTTDALKLFHKEILNKKEEDQCEQDNASSNKAALLENSSCNHLGKYVGELQSLLVECPAIQSHLAVN